MLNSVHIPWSGLLWTLLVLIIGYQALHWLEKAMIYIPEREFSAIPRTFALPYEDVALLSLNNNSIHGWYLPQAPFKTSPKAPAISGPLSSKNLVILLCHGNAGNISNRVHKANILHQLGLSVFLFDYQGYGKSQGSPSEKGTYQDAQAAYQYLIQVKKFKPGQIIVYGESLGNAIALETALRQKPAGLIMESAFTSIPAMAKEIFPLLPLGPLIKTRYDNLGKIPGLQCPLLIMHSQEDRVVPFAMGKKLWEAAPEPKEFLNMIGSHDEAYIDMGEHYPSAIKKFLARHVK